MTSLQKQTMMYPLPDQVYFEALLGKTIDERVTKVPPKIVVWFSAKWCGPCKKVDGDALMKAFPDVTFFKCDVDENNYTPGFCGVRSIPAFMAISNSKPLGSFQNSSTEAIQNWIQSVFHINK